MKIGILGTGAYGLSLASILVRNKHDVTMWTFSESELKELETTRRSPKLKEYSISKEITFTNDMKDIVNVDLIVIAVPAFAFENVVKELKNVIKEQPVLIATKGIQQETCMFLNEVYDKYIKNDLAVISGPTFASEIVMGIPIGLSLATKSENAENVIRKCFENETTKFRVTNDIIGVEICGAIKNVMAIASGMLEGMGVTDSTRALFLTESMNDIKELIEALNGNKKTILSFAGFGDILLTCTSKTSRNFSFGYLVGKGAGKEEIDNFLKNTTVEGMYTLRSIDDLIKKENVKLPIINLIDDIIRGEKEKEDLLTFLINK